MESKFFSVKELVCKHVYDRYGDRAAMFLDDKLIETINTVREKILCTPMTVNNWHLGGSFTQRGLRCNLCDLVREKSERQQLYLSAHCLGKGIDFTPEGMTAEEARRLIIGHSERLPWPIRLEEGVCGYTSMCTRWGLKKYHSSRLDPPLQTQKERHPTVSLLFIPLSAILNDGRQRCATGRGTC